MLVSYITLPATYITLPSFSNNTSRNMLTVASTPEFPVPTASMAVQNYCYRTSYRNIWRESAGSLQSSVHGALKKCTTGRYVSSLYSTVRYKLTLSDLTRHVTLSVSTSSNNQCCVCYIQYLFLPTIASHKTGV